MEPYFQTFPPPKRSVSFSHDGHLQEFEVDPGTEKRDFRYYDPNVSYATHCEPCQSDEDDVVLMPSRNRELEEISLRFDDAEKMDIVDEEGSQDTEGSEILKRGGSSCHQCKKKSKLLSFCCSIYHYQKKRMIGKSLKKCRKRYCDRCLHKFYGECAPMDRIRSDDWLCPACRLICSCGACKKNKGMQEENNFEYDYDDDDNDDWI